MAVNMLMRPWDFQVADANALTRPIMAGYDAGMKDRQVAVENKRADEQLGMQRERLGMERTKAARAEEEAKAHQFGKEVTALANQSPEVIAQYAPRLFARNPQYAAKFAENGIPTDNPQAAVRMLAQQYGEFDPLVQEQKRVQIEASRASTNLHNAQAGNVGKTSDIQEFEYAKRNGFPGAFEDWQKTKINQNASQNITWGRDAQGNLIPLQATRAGELTPSKMPAGVTAVPFPEMAATKASAQQQGKAQGQAIVDLPSVENSARQMISAIDALEKDPYLSNMTGWMGNLPNVTPSARNTQAKIDQIQGQTFLQAYNGLRGGGQITEVEGAKAEAAYSRLKETRVGTPEYRQALSDLKSEVNNLVALARRKAAGASGTPTQNAPAPSASGGGWGIRRLD